MLRISRSRASRAASCPGSRLNGDPHPGNYLFGGGKVTFLDYGLVKRFSAGELRPRISAN